MSRELLFCATPSWQSQAHVLSLLAFKSWPSWHSCSGIFCAVEGKPRADVQLSSLWDAGASVVVQMPSWELSLQPSHFIHQQAKGTTVKSPAQGHYGRQLSVWTLCSQIVVNCGLNDFSYEVSFFFLFDLFPLHFHHHCLVYFFIFYFFPVPCHMWNLNSLTRDWTWALCSASTESLKKIKLFIIIGG